MAQSLTMARSAFYLQTLGADLAWFLKTATSSD